MPAEGNDCSVLRRSCRHIGFLIPISVSLPWVDRLDSILTLKYSTRFSKIGKTQWNLGVEGWTEILKSWDYSRSSVEKHDFRKWNWIIFCFGPSSGQPENANLGCPSCCHSRGCDGRSRSACRSISGTSPKSISPSVQNGQNNSIRLDQRLLEWRLFVPEPYTKLMSRNGFM